MFLRFPEAGFTTPATVCIFLSVLFRISTFLFLVGNYLYAMEIVQMKHVTVNDSNYTIKRKFRSVPFLAEILINTLSGVFRATRQS